LKQTWFCGVHSNVGGGYKNHKQSDIVLAWIVDHMRPLLKFDQSYLDIICAQTDHDTNITTDEEDEMSLLDKLWYRFWPPTENSKVVAKRTKNWWIGDIYESYTWIYHISGRKPRTPGQYKLNGTTNEKIHPSVRLRYNNDPIWRKQCAALHKAGPFSDPKTGKWYWKVGKNTVGNDIIIEEDDVCNVNDQTVDPMQIQLAGKAGRAGLLAFLGM